MTEYDALDLRLRSHARRQHDAEPEAPDLGAILDVVQSRRRPQLPAWRTLAVAASIAVVAALAVTLAALHTATGSNPAGRGTSLSAAELQLARTVAHENAVGPAVPRRGAATSWPSTLTSAAVIAVDNGRASDYLRGAFGGPPVPSQALVIRLIGSFPWIGVSPPPCPVAAPCPPDTVTSLTIIVNPRTGKVFNISVSTRTPPMSLPDAHYLYKR